MFQFPAWVILFVLLRRRRGCVFVTVKAVNHKDFIEGGKAGDASIFYPLPLHPAQPRGRLIDGWDEYELPSDYTARSLATLRFQRLLKKHLFAANSNGQCQIQPKKY
uniref:Putative secreted protein n=1 Tax=Ixodes ricinus TaxID=34613 RepID=A0A6B0U9J2_IXORI